MHNKCDVLESSPNHLSTEAVEKPSSMKLVPSSKEPGDHCCSAPLVLLHIDGCWFEIDIAKLLSSIFLFKNPKRMLHFASYFSVSERKVTLFLL